MCKEIFKLIVKLILTPILLIETILILILYFVFGLIVVPAQSIRYLGLTTIAAIRSAFNNADYTNVFLDALYEFLKKYIAFYGQIFHIPLAIWISAEENPSTLQSIIKYEWEILSTNWCSTFLVFSALIVSVSLSFTLLGLKGLSKIDYIISKTSFSNSKDLAKITELEKQINQLKNKKPEVKTEYVDKIVYRDKPEPHHRYGKGKGKLVIYKNKTCSDDKTTNFWIDGVSSGRLDNFFSSKPDCDSTGTVSKIVLAGKHHIKGENEKGGKGGWEDYLVVQEDYCHFFEIECSK